MNSAKTARIDPMLIGASGYKNYSGPSCYLGWDRHTAMADFIVSRFGLEPADYEVPHVTELAAVEQACCRWPARVVIELAKQ